MFKSNLNNIHYQLSNQYDDIKLNEKSDRKFGEHVEMIIESDGIECRAIFTKRDLENQSFKWFYLSNPTDEESLVERRSDINTLLNDVTDIFENKRFSSEYLQK